MSNVETKNQNKTDNLVTSVYGIYLEEVPLMFEELDRHVFASEPTELINILHILAVKSTNVSAIRVARLARQIEMSLESQPHISRTHVARELQRLHMEFLAAKGELEFLVQSMRG